MLKFDLIHENENILAQAISDLVRDVFIGVLDMVEPSSTNQLFEALKGPDREELAKRIAVRLNVSSEHRDLEGIRSGGLNNIRATTRSLTQKFFGEIWSEELSSK